MFDEVDILLIGFMGGIAGAAGISALIYYHYKQMIKDYAYSNCSITDKSDLKKIKQDMVHIKMQLVALQTELNSTNNDEVY